MSEDGWSTRVRSYSVRHGRIVRFLYPSQRLRDRTNFSLTFFLLSLSSFMDGISLARNTQKNNNFAAIVTYQYFSPRQRKTAEKNTDHREKDDDRLFFFL